MAAVTAENLIAAGCTCSYCGAAFSNVNTPTISTGTGLFGTVAVDKAICTVAPYVDRHVLTGTVELIVYQEATADPNGLIEVPVNSLDPE